MIIHLFSTFLINCDHMWFLLYFVLSGLSMYNRHFCFPWKSVVFILKLSDSYCLLSGRRTTHNPFSSRDKPWDPYGVAKFDLSGLLLGQKYLHLRSPIHCCPLPDTHSGLQKPDGPVVGHPGNVDGPGTFLHEVP